MHTIFSIDKSYLNTRKFKKLKQGISIFQKKKVNRTPRKKLKQVISIFQKKKSIEPQENFGIVC